MVLGTQAMEVVQQLAPKGCADALGMELHSIVRQGSVRYALQDLVCCIAVYILPSFWLHTRCKSACLFLSDSLYDTEQSTPL